MENKDITTGNFNRILAMVTLNNFAISFVFIFVPIYLLKLGYSFPMVMVWMIIHYSVIAIASFLAIRISNNIGLVGLLFIRFALVFSYFILLLFCLKSTPNLFYIIPIIGGIETAFYFMPLNILMIRNTSSRNMGVSMSKLSAFPKILTIMSPLIGALIVTYFGFPTLFGFAMFLFLIAMIPVFSLHSEKTDFKFTIKRIKETYQNNKQYFLPEIIDNLAEDAMILWSVFIYLTLMSELQVGIIGTITAIASMFFVLTIGKLTDKWNKHTLIKIGAMFVTLVWIINFMIAQFIPNQWLFYVATIAITLSLKVFLVPYSSILFNKARKDDAEFIVLREIPTALGRLFLFLLAILFYNNLPILFLLVGLLFVYFWFLDTRKLE